MAGVCGSLLFGLRVDWCVQPHLRQQADQTMASDLTFEFQHWWWISSLKLMPFKCTFDLMVQSIKSLSENWMHSHQNKIGKKLETAMLKPISSVRWVFNRMKNRQRCLWLKSFQIGKYRNFLSTHFDEEDVLPSKLCYCILVDSQPQCHSHFFHFAFDFESKIKCEIDSLVCMANQMFQCSSAPCVWCSSRRLVACKPSIDNIAAIAFVKTLIINSKM